MIECDEARGQQRTKTMKVNGRSNRRTAPHSQTKKENGQSQKNELGWMLACRVQDLGRGVPPMKQVDEAKP